MAREYRTFDVTVPAGTTAAAPQVTALAMPARIVRRLRVRMPPGPRGLVGWRLATGGVQVIPWNTGAWVTGDDESLPYEPDNFPDAGAWQVIAYNAGRHNHTLTLEFHLDPPQGEAAGGPLTPLPVSAIMAPAVFVPAPQLPPPAVFGPEPDTGPPPPPVPLPEPEPSPLPFPAPSPLPLPEPEPEPLPEPAPFPLPEPAPFPLPEPAPLPPPVELPPPVDGYAMARVNAVAAAQAALGLPITVVAVVPPAPGTVARMAYDAGRTAALAALESI